MGKLKRDSIVITKIYATSVDEWYGVTVELNFTPPLPADPDQQDREFAHDVIRAIVNSHEYDEYFKTEHRVWVEEYEDGPEIEVRIPKFKEYDFDGWGFTAKDGYVSASTRM